MEEKDIEKLIKHCKNLCNEANQTTAILQDEFGTRTLSGAELCLNRIMVSPIDKLAKVLGTNPVACNHPLVPTLPILKLEYAGIMFYESVI